MKIGVYMAMATAMAAAYAETSDGMHRLHGKPFDKFMTHKSKIKRKKNKKLRGR